MKNRHIDPVDIIDNYFADLQEKYKSTVDEHEKNVLRKRLLNLQGVKQFLVSAQTGNSIQPANSLHRAA